MMGQILLFLATLDQLLQQENVVIEYWTVKKRKLEQCHQYVLFEQSAKQVSKFLEYLHVQVSISYSGVFFFFNALISLYINHCKLFTAVFIKILSPNI